MTGDENSDVFTYKLGTLAKMCLKQIEIYINKLLAKKQGLVQSFISALIRPIESIVPFRVRYIGILLYISL